MSDSLFVLRIVTPAKIIERRIRAIRLKDGSGYFGIMKGHIDFMTAVETSLCYYLDENGKEVFLAVDGGIVSVRGETVTITSREVFESFDAEKLAEIIENSIVKRDVSEGSFLNTIKGIERSFMEKSLEMMRGRS
jgi:F-type H+-transporting ATPase subunit epsilon